MVLVYGIPMVPHSIRGTKMFNTSQKGAFKPYNLHILDVRYFTARKLPIKHDKGNLIPHLSINVPPPRMHSVAGDAMAPPSTSSM
jgi:hypothetical protein